MIIFFEEFEHQVDLREQFQFGPMIEANMMRRFVHFVSFLILLCFHLQHNMAATDTILPAQQISFPETIISAGGVFELGFFNPGNSTNYYLGIWYKKIPTQRVVWVSNRDYPVSGTSGVLTINTDGNLVISDRQFLYMVTNITSKKGNTSATLLDSGNLILKDLNSVVSWQSFDNPSHVFLPGMKLGINKRTGSASSLVSWKSTDDPGSGAFSLKLDEQNSQFVLMQGTQKYWVSGSWNGKKFSLVPEMRLNYIFNYSYTSNENESYFTYSLYNASIISKLLMDVSGQIKQMTWLEISQQWNLFWSQQRYQCEVPGICGSFGVCNQEILSPCQCLFGFEPHSSEAWRQADRSDGCTRKVPLQCENTTAVHGEEDKFLKISNMKLPANGQQFVVGNGKECHFACLSNCSCSAYAYDGSGGCSIWTGGLLNLQQLQAEDKYGKTIYVKLAASELPSSGGNKKLLFLIIPVVASLLLGCYFSCQWRRNKRKQKGNMEPGQNILLFDMGLSNLTTNNEVSSNKAVGSGKSNDSGLPLFTFASVSAATDDFSAKNKLGEGGFGPVYKGKLLKGHKIAVKRLSKKSGQGLEEFKNEVVLIAKLQHRNLVKILGCCLEQEEKILIYEYMPNKSLDTFLFANPAKRGLLDWRARVRIVEGIAQGLLYLHQYSRLKIIHRDLKASNILLDADKNPKISDFGMARIFGGNETQANTNRIAGTYGYMAPEYALQGIFSEKSDVFSFGVLLLEIVSGKKNTGFYQSDSLNLLGYAWDLWKDDKALDLMDPVWGDESSKTILLRYIHVALLCVQEIAADRPTMSEVVSMLTNEVAVLPSPKQPAFSDLRSLKTTNAPMSGPEICSLNEISISLLEAR